MLLLLDNYDSFTYNVYQLLCDLGAKVEVVRNDQITVEEVAEKGYEAIVISPGPGVPKDAGITEELIDKMKGQLPILGICLGHQAIGEVFGGKVVGAGEIYHGKTSPISHVGEEIYQDVPQQVEVGRYHSLVVAREGLPDCLEITSELADGTIMGLKHKEYPVYGMQFHPESILTPQGRKMMENFLSLI
ncbi:Anthranilate synthase, amidotransferase component [Anaerovibrio sp. JC8]|uniref:anthranilate synthase component II n=1 Tax=Anaerovibrio sp. JC8 TaxID=1240085 RepID=UPI000A0D3708|nr:aminodeoxychorismate/anthranilate synthase component II [Anaerovibrio sp. JC8]ORU00773.1 Anthranilate synthase, amidotransferase component [Anaerovibrio sp. JC8]